MSLDRGKHQPSRDNSQSAYVFNSPEKKKKLFCNHTFEKVPFSFSSDFKKLVEGRKPKWHV